MYRRRPERANAELARVVAINTLDAGGHPQFIHSGTYEELIAAFHLSGAQLADAISRELARDRG